jgi:MoxR-like ATPase
MDYSNRDSLLNSNIVHLMSAARAAGLQFRNGLRKDEIVQALGRENLINRTWEILQKRKSQSGDLPSTLDDVEEAFRSKGVQVVASQTLSQAIPRESVPVPFGKPTQAPQSNPQPNQADALAAAIRAVAGGALDEARVREIAADVMGNVLAGITFPDYGKEISSQVAAAVAKLPQGTTIHLPPREEPIKLPLKQHFQFPDLLLYLQQGLHVFLVGGASTGKTFAAEQAALALSRKFHAQGAVTYAHELLGYIDAHSKYVRTQFREAFEHGGLILLDEFDASSSEAALVINSALANGFCSFPDGVIPRHENFLCVVGANTDGSGATMSYSGRARLDGAFLDRFVMLEWGIDPEIEKGKAKGQAQWLAAVRAVRAWMAQRGVLDVAATVRTVDYGSTLLHAGCDPEKVLTVCLKRGALAKEWKAIKALPAVNDFLTGF